MDDQDKRALLEITGGRIRFDRSMASYTRFGVGGPAEALLETGDMEEICRVWGFLQSRSVPVLVVGRGSNLLVRDRGVAGVVIVLRGRLASIDTSESRGLALKAGAGLALSRLLIHCRRRGLGGLEFLAGIPGTVGGAVAMNAGAFGADTGSRVEAVEGIDAHGKVVIRGREHLRFSYRSFACEGLWIVLWARFRLDASTPAEVAARLSGFLKRRKATQPLAYPSAGSVFKNPDGDYAGRLLEQAGLKGRRIGGAEISTKHANFIVNRGGARAEEILALMALAREEVKQRTGTDLEAEIQVVGR
jgi:UDP-N-acetylmuramate dehydrogenase